MVPSSTLSARDIERAAPSLAVLHRDGSVSFATSWWKHALLGLGSLVFLAFGVYGLVRSTLVMLGIEPAGIGRLGLPESWPLGMLFFPIPTLFGLAGLVVFVIGVFRRTRVTLSAAGIEIARGSRVDAQIPWPSVAGARVARTRLKLSTSSSAHIDWRREGVRWVTPVPTGLTQRPATIAALIEQARQSMQGSPAR